MSYLKSEKPFALKTITVGELIKFMQLGKVTLNPEYQREYVAKEYWKRDFIGSIFRRASNSVLHLRKMKDGTYEVLDGVQRLCTIRGFYLGEFKTPTYHGEGLPIYYDGNCLILPPSTMKDIQKMSNSDFLVDRFINFEISVIEYDEAMTDDEASEVFWSLNDNNTLKHQEKINGILGVISKWVREVSRRGEFYEILPVLKTIKVKSDGRMNLDEMVARAVLYEVWNQTKKDDGKKPNWCFGYADVSGLKELYMSPSYRYNEEAFIPIAKEVERRFEIVRRICKGSGKPSLHTATESKVLTLYQLTYALEEKFGKNYKIDFDVFAKKLWVIFSELADLKLMGVTSRKKTRFTELLSLYSPSEVKEKMALILGALEVYKNPGITVKDSRRFFSLDEKYRRWIDQGCKCALTGEEIDFDEAEGGHIIPHGKKGPTTYDNLVIIHKKWNSDMNDVPFYEYKEKFDKLHQKTA